MKQTDGLFHKVFDEIAQEYPEIANDHWIIDIGAARLADTPEIFDVIVMPNLYGDVMSDIAAQIAGSVGLAGSSNIGEECAMFEAIHGSAPLIAGKNIANPSGLLQGALLMLQHIGQNEVAEKIQNAWLYTLEQGIHTFDIYKEGSSKKQVSTSQFADAVIENLGKKPSQLKAAVFPTNVVMNLPKYQRKAPVKKDLLGVDLFVNWRGSNPDELAGLVKKISNGHTELTMITNRGIKVWPEGFPETFCTDHWRCRFKSKSNKQLSNKNIIELLTGAEGLQIDVVKTENLYAFAGTPAFSLGQGQ